jgi:tetratricopeptide (TPR) repeat protein
MLYMATVTGEAIRGSIILALAVLAVGTLIVLTILKAEDPARMAFRWVMTALVGAFMVWKVAPTVGQGGYGGAFVGIPLTAVCGLVLAIVWRHALAGLVAKPFADLYDGGSTPPEPRPAYSVAQARQKQGRPVEAVAEIRKQLDRFPTDFEGHILLAQIQAEDLQDLPGAELTIQHLCAQPGHAAPNIAFALYSMADWYLKYAQDREAAQRCLQEVTTLLPDTEFALTAAQRIAHLGTQEMFLPPEERKKYFVTEGLKNVGLARSTPALQPEEKKPGERATEYVSHLEQYPLDTEAREQLASIYLDHYGRLDLATDQLEQMIQQPARPAKSIVRWLNLMADFQIRAGADYETVLSTLQRIVDLDPKVAAAETARNRIALLRLELKAKQPNQTVKLGVYEQNLGLKGPSRKIADR